ncbi:MAG: ExbD/TolR family protein [Elusimicrobiota bacterium]
MSGMMPEEDESETDKINVVPLADLSLVLLIILMVLSPMVMSSMIKVQAPKLEKVSKSKLESNAKSPDPLLINISVSGITLNGNSIESDQLLAEQIAIKLSDEPERPVIVSAEDAILVGDVVRILDLAKQSGAQKVSLLKGSKEG